MARSKVYVPGFDALSDQVFYRKADSIPVVTDDASAKHPHAVIILAWGDGLPKHVLKYADGYQQLFPYATQVIVLSPIAKAIWSALPDRSIAMRPVLDTIFSSNVVDHDSQILVHCMSNAGGINCASTLHEYQQQFGQPLPHQLLVLDSTPGSPYLTLSTLQQWSRAMALGTASYFPWPFVITQGICAIFLSAHRLLERIIGRESAPIFSIGAINNETYESKAASRIYLYSKEDDLISYKDIESHAAEAKAHGYKTSVVVFEGSGHVGHARMFPERYWSAIKQAWEQTFALA